MSIIATSGSIDSSAPDMGRQKKMYPQLTFASVCKKYMKNDGKVLSFKAMLYKTATWAGGTTYGDE